MPETVLAIDLGSTWCKAAYIDRWGGTVAEGRVPSSWIVTGADDNPDAYWSVVVDAVRLANGMLPGPPAPAAVGIAARGLFGVCIDADGQGFVLATRSWPSVPSLYASGTYHALAWEADPFAFGYAVRLAGLLHAARELEPGQWRRIHRAGCLHDYLTWRLGGAWVTDPSSGPNGLSWPERMAQVSGLPLSVLPEIRTYWDLAGSLTAEAAVALGLPAGTPVVTGAHDGAAASMGVGMVQPGDACLTLGTNFALRAVTETRPETDCFGYLVAPDRWAWVNSVFGVATRLDAVVRLLTNASGDLAAHHLRLGNGEPGSALPALPLLDLPELLAAVEQARRDGYTDEAIYAALLKSAAAGVRGLVDRATADGAPSYRYVATGGGSRNPRLIAELTRALDTPVRTGHPEAGLLGVGMIAAIGAGWWPDLSAAWDAMGRQTVSKNQASPLPERHMHEPA